MGFVPEFHNKQRGQEMKIIQKSLINTPHGLVGALLAVRSGVSAAWVSDDEKYSILRTDYGLSICCRTDHPADGDIETIISHCMPECKVWRTEISSDSDIIRVINLDKGNC